MKISLVLSGGGARGYAHIGVIEELKKEGFTFSSIAGTSMGSVIGGMEASGNLQEYKEWVSSIEFLDIFKYYRPFFSLDGDKIFNTLKEMFGEINIEDLPIKYTAVATDLTKKKEIWFQKGDLYTAMHASSAIPGVFSPVRLKDRELVDGGVLNLMPVAPVMSDTQSELIIAVNVNSEAKNIEEIKIDKKLKERQTILEQFWDKIFRSKESVVDKSISLMMETIFRYRKAEYTPDIEIKIPQNIAKWYDFHRSLEIIEYGRFFTQKALKEAKKMGIISIEN